MQEKWIEDIRVGNDLTVRVWDKSRILAGDRCLVFLEACMGIPLKMDLLDAPENEKAFNALREICGSTLSYRHCQKKHFVDKMKKEDVLKDFLETFKKDVVPYLSHPDFPKRLLLSKQRELRAKRPDLFIEGRGNSC